MTEPYRLRYANQIVGAFLLVAIVAVVGLLTLLFSRLWVQRDHFYIAATETEVGDLRNGTEVLLLGQSIGQVAELRYLDGSDAVQVKIAIDSEYTDWITTDSEITLDRKYGVGPPVLAIRRKPIDDRTGPARPLAPGESIGRFRDRVDQVEKMTREVEAAGSSIDTAAKKITDSFTEQIDPAVAQSEITLQSVEKTSEAVRPETLETLQQIRSTTVKLENNVSDLTDRVNRLVEQDMRETIQAIRETALATSAAAQQVEKTAADLDTKTDSTNEEVIETLKSLRETALLIQQLTNETRSVVQIVRAEAEDLPGTTRRVNDTVSDTQELVGDIGEHWLLRRYRNERKPTEQVSPSAIRSGGIR